MDIRGGRANGHGEESESEIDQEGERSMKLSLWQSLESSRTMESSQAKSARQGLIAMSSIVLLVLHGPLQRVWP